MAPLPKDTNSMTNIGMVMDLPDVDDNKKHVHFQKLFTGKVIVIGTGRFGNALAQGIRESYLQISKGKMLKANVEQVACRDFLSLDEEEMVEKLDGSDYICYTGVFLARYAAKLAKSMQMVATRNQLAPLEFIDCKYKPFLR